MSRLDDIKTKLKETNLIHDEKLLDQFARILHRNEKVKNLKSNVQTLYQDQLNK